MTAPPRIWLQWDGDGEPSPDDPDHSDVTWAADRVFDGDVEYIRADLVEPRHAVHCPYWCGRCDGQAIGRHCCIGPAHLIDCECGGRPLDDECPDCGPACLHPDGVTGAHCPYCADAGECSFITHGVCATCGRLVG